MLAPRTKDRVRALADIMEALDLCDIPADETVRVHSRGAQSVADERDALAARFAKRGVSASVIDRIALVAEFRRLLSELS